MMSSTFKTIIGTQPVLLSAPHVYAHRRPRLSMAYKVGEPFTDTIVEEVCRNIKSFGIVLTEESDRDFNYHQEKCNPYKQEIRKIVERNKIEYFVDIHGLKDVNEYDVGIYYPSKFFRSIDLARKMREGLNRFSLRGVNIMVLRLPSGPQESLSLFVASQLRIPSVQIEVARYIREKKELRDAFVENLGKLLESLVI